MCAFLKEKKYSFGSREWIYSISFGTLVWCVYIVVIVVRFHFVRFGLVFFVVVFRSNQQPFGCIYLIFGLFVYLFKFNGQQQRARKKMCRLIDGKWICLCECLSRGWALYNRRPVQIKRLPCKWFYLFNFDHKMFDRRPMFSFFFKKFQHFFFLAEICVLFDNNKNA